METRCGVLFASWDALSQLFVRWGDRAPHLVLDWHASLSAAQSDRLAQLLCRLTTLRCGPDGAFVTLFHLLPCGARRAVTALLLQRADRFPAALRTELASRVPELGSLSVADATAAVSPRKRSRDPDAADDIDFSSGDETGSAVVLVAKTARPRAVLNLEGSQASQRPAPSSVSSIVLDLVDDDPLPEPAAAAASVAAPVAADDGDRLDAHVVEGLRRSVATQSASQLGAFSEEQLRLVGHAENAAAVAAALEGVDEEALGRFFGACGVGVDAAVGVRAWSALLSAVLLPRVASLSRPASRGLVAVFRACVRANGRAAVAALLLPLLQAAQPSQCDLVALSLDDLDDTTAATLVRALCASPWSDGVLTVLQKALARPLPLDDDDCGRVLGCAQQQLDAHRASVRFAKLLLAFVTRFRAAFSPASLATARAVAAELTSFMAKALQAKLG